MTCAIAHRAAQCPTAAPVVVPGQRRTVGWRSTLRSTALYGSCVISAFFSAPSPAKAPDRRDGPALARQAEALVPGQTSAITAWRTAVRLLLVGVLCATTSACVARTAVKATTKVAKTTVKAAGAVGCVAVDVVVSDPKCKE